LTIAGAGAAQASAYTPSPPTNGTLYTDGQTGRYLLGGTWLYRDDPSDAGVAQGWWRDAAATGGWSPITVPNAYNARDFSSTSMAGYVGWYRRGVSCQSAYAPLDVVGQSNSVAYHLGAFATKPWLSGVIYFPLQDFAARPGWGGGDPWPAPPFVQKGLVDLYGNAKPAFSVVSSLYHSTVQIGPAQTRRSQ
jgi:hypothetical protein